MIKRYVGAAALMLLVLPLVASTSAQAQQMGYTNQEAILANMPEMQQVRQQLQQEAQAQQQEFQQEQQEFQQKVETYQKQQSLLSDQRRSEREQELRQLRDSLQQSAEQRDQFLAQREAELMQPLLEELQGAIEAEAEAQSLNVVLRTQALLYVNEDAVVDITPEVASRLGIEVQNVEAGPSADPVDAGINTGSGGQ